MENIEFNNKVFALEVTELTIRSGLWFASKIEIYKEKFNL